jgi:hypothetical protein
MADRNDDLIALANQHAQRQAYEQIQRDYEGNSRAYWDAIKAGKTDDAAWCLRNARNLEIEARELLGTAQAQQQQQPQQQFSQAEQDLLRDYPQIASDPQKWQTALAAANNLIVRGYDRNSAEYIQAIAHAVGILNSDMTESLEVASPNGAHLPIEIRQRFSRRVQCRGSKIDRRKARRKPANEPIVSNNMTDEQQTELPKRGPGRPPGGKNKPGHHAGRKKPNADRQPVHQGRSGDDEPDKLENFEFTPYEAQDALAIDADVVRSIRDDYGFVLMWVVHECNGKPFPDLVNARQRNGFAEVKAENFGGVLRHMANKDGAIVKEGLVLMARPVQIERKARAHDERMAKGAIEQMKRSHSELGPEGITMPDGNNKIARAKNMHRQTFEPLPRNARRRMRQAFQKPNTESKSSKCKR